MPSLRTTERLWLFLALAFLGAVLLYIPPQILEQYERIAKFGTVWTVVYFSVVGLGAAIFLFLAGMLVWKLWGNTVRKNRRLNEQNKSPSELSAAERQRQIDDNLADARDLQRDAAIDPALRENLQALANRLETKQQAQRLEIVAFGTISSGKSSLLNALAGRDVFLTDLKGGTTTQRKEITWRDDDRLILVDTPGLGEIEGSEHVAAAAESAKDADVLLMVVDGPLRQAEFRLLEQLGRMEKRLLVCINKSDWYTEADLASLRQQLLAQLGQIVRPGELVAVRSLPTKRLRTRLLAGGGEEEELIEVPPDISQLATKLMEVVRHDGQDLLLANLLLQSRGLVEESKKQVQAALDKQAWSMVDRFTWGSAGAAALSPLPMIDLIAGSAIIVKMVLDLAKHYRQDVDSDLAVKLLGQLGKNLIASLGISAAAPAVAASVASLLKTVPGAGSLAGGLLQGIVQALITRWIGGIFIEYFRAGMQQPEGGLAGLAAREWKKITTATALYQFVQEARQQLGGKGSEAGGQGSGVGEERAAEGRRK